MQRIETRQHSVSQGALLRAVWRDGAIRTRLILIALLSLVLGEAIQWAMEVTHANATRISSNIVHIQEGKEVQATSQKRVVPLRAGPIIEALKERPRHRKRR
jgi:hypothetical protein